MQGLLVRQESIRPHKRYGDNECRLLVASAAVLLLQVVALATYHWVRRRTDDFTTHAGLFETKNSGGTVQLLHCGDLDDDDCDTLRSTIAAAISSAVFGLHHVALMGLFVFKKSCHMDSQWGHGAWGMGMLQVAFGILALAMYAHFRSQYYENMDDDTDRDDTDYDWSWVLFLLSVIFATIFNCVFTYMASKGHYGFFLRRQRSGSDDLLESVTGSAPLLG